MLYTDLNQTLLHLFYCNTGQWLFYTNGMNKRMRLMAAETLVR